jgi:hypothetical protein
VVDDELGSGPRPDGRDELVNGTEHGSWVVAGRVTSRWSRLPSGVRTVAVALVGAVIGAVVWQGLHPTATRGTAQPAPSIPPNGLLQAQNVCTRYSGEILQVGFQLTNVGQRPVKIVVVRPDLPLGMLLELGVDLTSEPCRSTSTRQGAAAVPSNGLLEPGASQAVTFRLVPVVGCAKPAPVAASVELGDDISPAVVTIPVLVDLGSVSFPACTAATS